MRVFISGSIAIKSIQPKVAESLDKIIDKGIQILVGDASGVDSLIQSYVKQRNYHNVVVYSIFPSPRNLLTGFKKKYIETTAQSKKGRESQIEKDKAMTIDSDFSLVIWDGKSKGSYQNIIRAIDAEKKLKVFFQSENRYIEPEKNTSNEINFIYRKNIGYTAKEVVELLKSEGEGYFQHTRSLNKCMLEQQILTKENGVYLPVSGYENMFIFDKYRGKVKGVRFTNEFINWLEDWIKNNRLPEVPGMF